MKFLYNLVIMCYYLAIRVAAITGNQKARQWVDGRKEWKSKMKVVEGWKEKRIWVHCSSLGEFEQGRPVIEALRESKPEFKIILTFFSPSGYEVRKKYEGADAVFYLPLDTAQNARIFLSILNPSAIFFIKYDYWFHYLDEAFKKKIPIYFVSAIFRPSQFFFKIFGTFNRRMLRLVTHFFIQDEASAKLLQSIGIKNFSVSGDSRFDRVVRISKEAKSLPAIEKFKGASRLIIGGSTWPEDDSILIDTFTTIDNEQNKLILVPHEATMSSMTDLSNRLASLFGSNGFAFYSHFNNEDCQAKVLVIDTIGILSSAYRYADIAFIGGGFGKGIHNTLEAAICGIPVLFGPNYHKFKEAVELLECGGAFTVKDGEQLKNKISDLLEKPEIRRTSGNAAREYVLRNTGATGKVMEEVFGLKE